MTLYIGVDIHARQQMVSFFGHGGWDHGPGGVEHEGDDVKECRIVKGRRPMLARAEIDYAEFLRRGKKETEEQLSTKALELSNLN
jgi:hypothetical protein